MTDAELHALAEMAKPSWRWSVSWCENVINGGATPFGDDHAASLIIAKAECEAAARRAGLAVPL